MTVTNRIEINPKVMQGKPVIRGTRIPVELLLRKFADGATEADLLDAYPRLTREDLQAAIGYAADVLAHEETVILTPRKEPQRRVIVRFLADESCDFAVVRALRSAGFDVVAVAEVVPRALDEAVIELAVLEDRIVLTEDKDFGQLVYGSGRPSSGVILLRFPGRARSSIPEAVLRVVNEQGARLAGAFTIVQPGRLRIRRLQPGHHQLVLAFWDGQSRGMLHTITEAQRRGIPVKIYGTDPIPL